MLPFNSSACDTVLPLNRSDIGPLNSQKENTVVNPVKNLTIAKKEALRTLQHAAVKEFIGVALNGMQVMKCDFIEVLLKWFHELSRP